MSEESRRLDPRATTLFFSSAVVWILILAVAAFFLIVISPLKESGYREILPSESLARLLTVSLVVLLVLFIVSYLWAVMYYDSYKYSLHDIGIQIEKGVIWKQKITIPYDRIQNVDIYRGPLARMIGLSDLHIQTAGSSNPHFWGEGRLRGLSPEVAEKLKDELLILARNKKNQGI